MEEYRPVRAIPDRSRINLDEIHEVKYWTRELRVSESKLKELVAKVGAAADKVRRAALSM